jgi:hypothetical protein
MGELGEFPRLSGLSSWEVATLLRVGVVFCCESGGQLGEHWMSTAKE